MPLYYLRQSEIPVTDITLVRPLGPRAKEVDYQGEMAGVRSVREGRADAAFVGYKFWDQILSKNEDGGTPLDIVWQSPPRGHCVFTTLETVEPELATGFMDQLYKMDYSDPEQRQIMDLEWLKAWVPAKMEGAYDDLMAATAQ
jgi:ABC-type phosphate/phosphonate transport system substrate-binding protein